ncbi:MAG: VWA domain-containing protein [Devosiaceae bacterium]|nr:VWA domain-containing protein [Devosiaceae bacterium MH13]
MPNTLPKPAGALHGLKARLRSTFSAFSRDARGTVVVLYAMALVPVVGLTGAAIDYTRATDAQVNFQAAADAAVLAATTASLPTLQAREDLARQVFGAHAPDPGHTLENLSLSETENGYQLSVTGSVDSTLLEVMHIDTVRFGVESSAVAAGEPLEVAFVIDATNSMLRGSRWQTAYDSLDAMLDTLNRSTRGPGDLIVTVVPMGDTVNIGSHRQDWVWGLEGQDEGTWPAQADPLDADDWDGCVFAREEPTAENPYHLSDAPHDDFLFEVMDQDERNHAYEGRGSRQFKCPHEVIGPMEDVNEVMRQVDRIRAAGTGRFDQGMAWGWRAVSSRWQDAWEIEDHPNPEVQRRKVVVFISDGKSTMEEWRFDGVQEWGYNNAGTEMLGNLVDVCDQAKEDGVTVFTLFVEGNRHARSYMEDCASSATHFYDVTRNEDMADAFQTMGVELSNARLVR